MRRFINIVENAQGQGVVPADEVARLVQSIHHRPEDLGEGDLLDRIYRFTQYVLRPIPLDQLNTRQWYVDDDLVDDYAGCPGDAPPIVYDAVADSIIDGIHRANAAIKRGEHEIMAYVGLLENLDPDHVGDDE